MARRRRSRSLKGLGFSAGMSGTQFVIGAAIGAAIGAVAMHFYMKDSTPLKGLGARARPSRGDSNRCVPSLCAQGLTVYCC